jgi:hypothetical protein
MKAWEVVGWTADADAWCNACAEDAYGEDSPTRLDSEGNPVNPVFASDEYGGYVCGNCLTPIVETI